jgi:hypothetical protein
MQNKKNISTNLEDHYQSFLEVTSRRELIELLEIAYRETRNEKVYKALAKLKAIEAVWYDMDAERRHIEIQEMLDHPDHYPHTVISWLTKYREQELED